eukprot:886896-Pyramimonas_sp.AAC.1
MRQTTQDLHGKMRTEYQREADAREWVDRLLLWHSAHAGGAFFSRRKVNQDSEPLPIFGNSELANEPREARALRASAIIHRIRQIRSPKPILAPCDDHGAFEREIYI